MTRRHAGALILVAVAVYTTYIVLPFVAPFSIEATPTSVDGAYSADILYTATPRGVLRFGDCVTLTWQVSNTASAVTLDGVPVAHSGEQQACIEEVQAHDEIAAPELAVYLEDGTRTRLSQNVIVLEWFRVVSLGVVAAMGGGLYALVLLGVWRVPTGIGYRTAVIEQRFLPIWYIGILVPWILLIIGHTIIDFRNYPLSGAFISLDWGIALLAFLRGIASVGFYTTACLATGAIIFRAFGPLPRDIRPVTLATTMFFLGMGVLAAVFLGLAVFGRMSLLEVAIVLGIACLTGIRWAWPVVRAVPGDILGAMKRGWVSETPVWRLILVMVCVVLGLSLLMMISPLDTDSAILYLLSARLTAISSELTTLRYSHLIRTGFYVEAQFSAMLLLSGSTAARMLSWLSSMGMTVMSLAIASQVGVARRGKLVLLAMLFSSTIILRLGVFAKTDMIATALALATIYWAFKMSSADWRRASALTGLLAGFTVMSKQTYAPLLLVYLLVFLVWRHRGDRLPLRLTWVAVFGLLPVVTFFLRNQLLFGEPLAPIVYFNPPPIPDLGVPLLERWGLYQEDIVWASRAVYPLISAIFYQEEGRISYLAGLLLPALFWSRPHPLRNLPLRQMMIATVAALVVWNLVTFALVEIRYVLAFWVLLYVLFAACAERVSGHHIRWVQTATIIGMTSALVYIASSMLYGTNYFSTMANQTCDIDTGCFAAPYLNEHAAPGDRVAYFGRHAIYLRDDLLMCQSNEAEMIELERGDVWQNAYDSGFEYLVFDREYRDFWSIALYPDAIPENLTVTTLIETYDEKDEPYLAIYKLDAGAQPANVTEVCEQNNRGVWELRSIPEDVK